MTSQPIRLSLFAANVLKILHRAICRGGAFPARLPSGAEPILDMAHVRLTPTSMIDVPISVRHLRTAAAELVEPKASPHIVGAAPVVR